MANGNFYLLTVSSNLTRYWLCEELVIKDSLEPGPSGVLPAYPPPTPSPCHELFLQDCRCPLRVCNGKRAWTLVHWNEVTLQSRGKHLSIKYFLSGAWKGKAGNSNECWKNRLSFLGNTFQFFLKDLVWKFSPPFIFQPTCVSRETQSFYCWFIDT